MDKSKTLMIFFSISIFLSVTIFIPKAGTQIPDGKPPCCLYYNKADLQVMSAALDSVQPTDFKILGVVEKIAIPEIYVSVYAAIHKTSVKDLRKRKKILKFLIPNFLNIKELFEFMKLNKKDYIVLIPGKIHYEVRFKDAGLKDKASRLKTNNVFYMYDFIIIPKEIVK